MTKKEAQEKLNRLTNKLNGKDQDSIEIRFSNGQTLYQKRRNQSTSKPQTETEVERILMHPISFKVR